MNRTVRIQTDLLESGREMSTPESKTAGDTRGNR